MCFIKKTILAIIIIAGMLTLTREFHEFGTKTGLILSAVFVLSTAFLWKWSSGSLPQVSKFHTILMMMAFTLVFLGTIDYAMADAMNVDLREVVRVTLKHSPGFYLVTFVSSGLKVFLWRWLFAGVREENEAKAIQA